MKIETYTGLEFDYENPTPDQINVADIARALSLTTRFGGHASQFYSVAEHALLVRQLVAQTGRHDLELAALHHDSHEAYLGDIPSPLKALLGYLYHDLADKVDGAIRHCFGLYDIDDVFYHPIIKQADADALIIEARQLKKSRGEGRLWGSSKAAADPDRRMPDFWRFGRTSAEAEAEFLKVHHRLVAA